MKPYEVKLEFFEGPLDLLLFLIKKEDMDIRDIQISKITQEYLATIHLLKELNLELAGEFLVMASTSMQIKAHTLLPEEAKLEALADGPDPRAELVAKLLEYQKFKEAAKILSEKELEVKEIYYRNSLPIFEPDDFSMDATLFDLLDAFKKVLKDASQELKELLYEEIPLEQKIREILDVLEQKESLAFIQIFESSRTKREFIITFLALLELIRLKQIVAKQTELFGEIRIYKLEEAVTQNPLVSGENQPLSN